jgi:hypothetical protein
MTTDTADTAVIAIDDELAATLAALGGSGRRRRPATHNPPALVVPARQAEDRAAHVAVRVIPVSRDYDGETTALDPTDEAALDAAVIHATELWNRRGGRPG